MERTRKYAEEQALQYISSPPLAMYDIGVGIYSEWETMKEAFPNLKLFGCEPHTEECLALKPIFPGELLNTAISDVGGHKILYKSKLGKGGSSLLPYTCLDNPTAVPCLTLDEFDRWAGYQQRILLWMDIEGGELLALKGGTELLRSGRVEWINLETRDWLPQNFVDMGYPTTKEITDHLAQYGYAPVNRYNIQGSEPSALGDVLYLKHNGAEWQATKDKHWR